jgi:hypothetical protein
MEHFIFPSFKGANVKVYVKYSFFGVPSLLYGRTSCKYGTRKEGWGENIEIQREKWII